MANDRRSLPEITEEVKRTYHSIRCAYSSGGVAYQPLDSPDGHADDNGHVEPQIKIALIATRGRTCWQLPKGTREAGESSIDTAIREVEEEVGLWTKQEAFLKTVEYWYWDTYRKDVPDLVHKQVDFYLLGVTGGELSDASYEVDGVGWFTPAEAMREMTFEGERLVVQLALESLKNIQRHSA